MYAWVLAATLVCGASVFTSCESNDDNPVIVANYPTITIQSEGTTYTIGDTTYPKMNIAAIASAGELTYEWFVKNVDGSYYSSGITTAELDLQAFIENVLAIWREEAIGDYTFMCKVTDGKGTVESKPITLTIVANTTAPSILEQPTSATYNIGDTKYPKLSVAAIASAGGLTYEWFVKSENDYYSSGIKTAELDLQAFIENMLDMFHEDAIGSYTFMCKVTDGNGTVESKPVTLTIVDIPESGLAENLIGKWMVDGLDGQPCPTNMKAVITFLSPTKAYGSLSDFYSDSWNSHASAEVVIDGNNVTLTAFENEHTIHITVTDIYSITDKDMRLKSDWKVYINGEKVIDEVYDNEHYVRINDDYEKDIIGTWEGKVTSAEDDHTDGELHRWEYRADGTFIYYNKVGDEWVNNNDVLAEYFVDGILLCTRWKNTADSKEQREWWEIESIKDGVMKWTALRMRDNGTTYTATFQMTKVK